MFDSLEDEIKKQNELLQQILDKGGLGVVVEGLESVVPDKVNVSTYPCNYDKMKRQVFWRVGERVSDIVKLHAEIKYFSQFIDNQYKSAKELEELGGGVDLREDIKDFIKKYEEEHGKTNQ
jgi:hypothetical protein|nr:MAG TPA: hypothetical protein [Caudoviricetes sp.]